MSHGNEDRFYRTDMYQKEAKNEKTAYGKNTLTNHNEVHEGNPTH